ncbi:MAG TPA: DUF4157 domain-containing protein [Burkholderiaceae bacterium]|nr:DUF4157 domain-containing protein [Burkholderiaceae bacterium]
MARFSALARPSAGPRATNARLLQRACSCGGRSKGVCEECRKKQLQRKPQPGNASLNVTPQLAGGGGTPLDPNLRRQLEPLFGRDFGAVRLHDDAGSHAAADQLAARAFTVGNDVHFAAGAWQPHSRDGLRLLAHELTHTVQQAATGSAVPATAPLEVGAADSPLEREADQVADRVVAGLAGGTIASSAHAPQVQRQPKEKEKKAPAPSKLGDPKTPADVVVLMDEDSLAQANIIAPGAILLRVDSPEKMASELARVQAPFKTLFVMSHSLASGDLGFKQGNTTNYVRPEKVAAAIKGAIPADRAPATVDFRGCSLGATPGAMDQIRTAVGAQTAIGANCFMVQQTNGPIKLNRGVEVRKRSDLKESDKEEFALGLKMLGDAFGPAKKCIIDATEDAYFRANGQWVALWVNHIFSTEWDQRASRCYATVARETVPAAEAAGKKLTAMVTGDCKVVRVEGGTTAPTQTAPKKAPQVQETR